MNRPKHPHKGQRFGLLKAVEEAGRDARGNLKWRFQCACGEEVIWRVSTARSNAKSGWCSCPQCYRAAGGAAIFKEARTRLDCVKAEIQNLLATHGPLTANQLTTMIARRRQTVLEAISLLDKEQAEVVPASGTTK